MMGLTFFIQERDGVRLIWHSGGQNAYASYFFIHPESKTGYVVAYNSVPESGARGKNPSSPGSTTSSRPGSCRSSSGNDPPKRE